VATAVGAGYFALKLSPIVGPHGAVLAEDIRRESLVFLWIRHVVRNARNLRVIRGEPRQTRLKTRDLRSSPGTTASSIGPAMTTSGDSSWPGSPESVPVPPSGGHELMAEPNDGVNGVNQMKHG
jgi:hypothetical protein